MIKQSKKQIPKLKRKLTKIFNEYIRLRDKKYYKGLCISCGKPGNQAGHYFSTSQCPQPSMIFNEKNVNIQCLTKESKIRMFNGIQKSIKDIKVGDYLWAFDKETFELKKSKVVRKTSFIPKELFEVELEDGNKFYATKNHEVVSKGKFVSIKEMLHNITTHDILEL